MGTKPRRVVTAAFLFLISPFVGHAATGIQTSAAEVAILATGAVTEVNESQIRVSLHQPFERLNGMGGELLTVPIPVRAGQQVELTLSRFSVVTPNARLIIGGVTQAITALPVFYRGEVVGVEGSLAFFSVTPANRVEGFIRTGADAYLLSTELDALGVATDKLLVKRINGSFGELPEGVRLCGLDDSEVARSGRSSNAAGILHAAGPRLISVGIDADSAFVAVFPTTGDCTNYITQLVGAVSAIYIRDVHLRLALDFIRLWPSGGEPFAADDVGGFRDHWVDNEDTSGLDMVHLLSGRRDLPYGGVAFLNNGCNDYSYGVDGFLNGTFYTPVQYPHPDNWDLVVVAHEMGHNLGTHHTHSGQYEPHIDDCGNGTPARGSIMSYCHTFPGYILNTDLIMHRRVEAVIDSLVGEGGCFVYDCNGNNVDDATDILLGSSFDTNADMIPDECQDCDSDGILDPLDSPDLNFNDIPDNCEQNCNGNGFPDEMDIRLGTSEDINGNNVPDECDPDCDNDNISDFVEISVDLSLDLNRDAIPDSCDDCNNNSRPDMEDLEHQHNWLVADSQAGGIHEYHVTSGVNVQTLTNAAPLPTSIAIGKNNVIYTIDGGSLIYRTNFYTGVGSPLNSQPIEGLRSLCMLNKYVLVGDSVGNLHKIDPNNGDIVTSVSAFGSAPRVLLHAADGFVYAGCEDNAVYRIGETLTGAVSTFVTAGSGGLNGPRGMVFAPDGELLITSYFTNAILQYDGTSGAFVRQLTDNQVPLDGPYGIAISDLGNVLVVRSGGAPRVLEYFYPSGLYFRSLVRGDVSMMAPTAIARLPQSQFDCNGNGQFDSCDIDFGSSLDVNADGRPDECAPLAGCCESLTGNVDCGLDDNVDISDLTVLIDHLFISSLPLCCVEEANTDGDIAGSVDISDLTVLIDHLFISLSPTEPCQ